MELETIAGMARQGALPADTPTVKSKLPEKKKLVKRLKELYEKRRDYVDRWIEIRDYQLPFIGEFDETSDKMNPAKRKDLKIAQGVAWLACQVFAAGVMSGLTPPARQWFRFAYKRPDLNTNVEAMKVLDQRQEIVSYILAKSNFYNSVHSVYLELPFGQCPLAIFYDPINGVRFQAMTIGTYALGVDGYGKVQTFARKYEMTLPQIVDCFGLESLPKEKQDFVKSGIGLDKKYQVNWLVEPNDERLPGYVDKLNMPYRSVYWLDKSEEDEFLYVGGFEEWAIPVARYLVNGLEPYGKGPGWFAEGDSKMLQLLKKDYLTAVELSIKPPMKGPATLMNNGGINLIPGGLTAVDDQNSQMVAPLFNVNLDLAHAEQEIIRVEDAIKRAYSADLFLMLDSLDNGRMTAREVMERTQEKLQQLGPVVERLQDEFLSVAIQRVYNIIDRSGGFPPIPEELIDVISEEDIEVDYISPLAQAQKMSGLVNIEQGIAQVAQMAQLWPEVLKKVDPIATVSKYFEMLGAPAVMQRSNEVVAELIEQEQKAMQEQQQMAEGMAMAQAAAPLADAAKNMTEAANDANPALTSWLGVPGGWE
jgi:hypothetical protein